MHSLHLIVFYLAVFTSLFLQATATPPSNSMHGGVSPSCKSSHATIRQRQQPWQWQLDEWLTLNDLPVVYLPHCQCTVAVSSMWHSMWTSLTAPTWRSDPSAIPSYTTQGNIRVNDVQTGDVIGYLSKSTFDSQLHQYSNQDDALLVQITLPVGTTSMANEVGVGDVSMCLCQIASLVIPEFQYHIPPFGSHWHYRSWEWRHRARLWRVCSLFRPQLGWQWFPPAMDTLLVRIQVCGLTYRIFIFDSQLSFLDHRMLVIHLLLVLVLIVVVNLLWYVLQATLECTICEWWLSSVEHQPHIRWYNSPVVQCRTMWVVVIVI